MARKGIIRIEHHTTPHHTARYQWFSNYLWPAAPKAAPTMALSVAALSASERKGRERRIR
jgi:hypothetical protein